MSTGSASILEKSNELDLTLLDEERAATPLASIGETTATQ